MVSDVATLDQAGPGQLTFLDNPKYAEALPQTRAEACILHAKYAAAAPAGTALLIAPNPYLSYARAAQLFYPAALPAAGCHPSAVVEIGRASWREKCVSTCRSRWSPYH